MRVATEHSSGNGGSDEGDGQEIRMLCLRGQRETGYGETVTGGFPSATRDLRESAEFRATRRAMGTLAILPGTSAKTHRKKQGSARGPPGCRARPRRTAAGATDPRLAFAEEETAPMPDHRTACPALQFSNGPLASPGVGDIYICQP